MSVVIRKAYKQGTGGVIEFKGNDEAAVKEAAETEFKTIDRMRSPNIRHSELPSGQFFTVIKFYGLD